MALKANLRSALSHKKNLCTSKKVNCVLENFLRLFIINLDFMKYFWKFKFEEFYGNPSWPYVTFQDLEENLVTRPWTILDEVLSIAWNEW